MPKPEPSLPAEGMIVRQKEPVNFEFPFHRLDSFLTPNELFYIRSHFPAPPIHVASYRLQVEGVVTEPLSFTYDQLRGLPATTQTATLECAGNSRVFLVPPAEGAQWGLGAVGTAAWTGVPLHLLLQQAGITVADCEAAGACEIIFEGADCGMPKEKPLPPMPITYARSLPLQRALRPDVLLAYQMNGEDLSPDHGYPLRLIVPGHYGMASVKWLRAIQIVREPFAGYWQTSDYAYWDQAAGHPVRRPLAHMQLKSQIARPGIYETVPAGSEYLITGAAWCGTGSIADVEVSTDGGEHWLPADLIDPVQPFAWRRWQLLWQVPAATGPITLLARAKDSGGNAQPEAHDPNFGPYVINHLLSVPVMVR